MQQVPNKNNLAVSLGMALITLYQKTFSPDHGPLKRFFPYGYCRFHPSCSEYTRKTMSKRGFILGLLYGSWRIIRCNPWSSGGIDEPPLTK